MGRETLLLSAQVPYWDADISQLLGSGMVVYERLITQHPCPKEGHFCSMPHTQLRSHGAMLRRMLL